MIRLFLLMIITCISSTSYAICSGSGIKYATPIFIDLSNELTSANPEFSRTIMTQYSGSFNCTTNNNEFAYTPILSTDNRYATILGFNNNMTKVRVEITSEQQNRKLSSSGTHSASMLNVPFVVRFSLVEQNGTPVTGDTATLNDVLFVSDMSGLSFFEIIGWPLKQLVKIAQWLFNGFNWPYDSRDMYGQPMIIKYEPKRTTCSFDNAGLTVNLPSLGLSQVSQNSQPGLTPFALNMSCKDIGSGRRSDQTIEMFLSSNSLLSTDNTVLIDNSSNGAHGIGLRLIQRDIPQKTVMISSSATNRGTATTLFNVAVGGLLNDHFTIPLAVHYFIWNPTIIRQGKINTTATLNIIYL